MRFILTIVLMWIIAAPCFSAPGNTAAGLAGVGAGAALGAGAGQAGATTSAGAGGAGGAGGGASTAPIEVQIMAYKGLSDIAGDIATITEKNLCEGAAATEKADDEDRSATPAVSSKPASAEPVQGLQVEVAKIEKKIDGKCLESQHAAILLEDSNSALQIALYQSLLGYHDQLAQLQTELTDIFSLVVSPPELSLKSSSADLTFSALGYTVLKDVAIKTEGADRGRFTLSPEKCPEVSAPKPCTVTVTFVPPLDVATTHTYSADLKISTGSYAWNRTIQLTATFTPPKKTAHHGATEAQTILAAEDRASLLETTALPGATPATPAAPAAAAATPLSLTYLSGIGTALSGIKSAMSYSSSSLQPTTQSFEVLLENELKQKNIEPYTSTSALELTGAAKTLSKIFGDMLMWGAQIDFWNTQCKPPDPAKVSDDDTPAKNKAVKDKKPAQNAECTSTAVITNLAQATQLITGYTTLLTTSSDGNGSPVIADVLRGAVLAKKLNHKMKSLQVNVVAAAGSTRSDAYFLLNIFYLPKPSYNSGVIATFELRKGNNDLILSGARTAFFDYNKKWKGQQFDGRTLKDRASCTDSDTFCVEKIK